MGAKGWFVLMWRQQHQTPFFLFPHLPLAVLTYTSAQILFSAKISEPPTFSSLSHLQRRFPPFCHRGCFAQYVHRLIVSSIPSNIFLSRPFHLLDTAKASLPLQYKNTAVHGFPLLPTLTPTLILTPPTSPDVECPPLPLATSTWILPLIFIAPNPS